MNHNYCPTCYMEFQEQVKLIPIDIEKSVKGKEINRCIKRRHVIKGDGLTLSRLKELDRFYKGRKPGFDRPVHDTSNVSKRW